MSDENASRIMVAVKAAYPELWPDRALEPGEAAELIGPRQDAVVRMNKALKAAEFVAGDKTQSVTLILPDQAAMVEQTLAISTYVREDGSQGFAIQMLGGGPLPLWLGLAELAKDYVFNEARRPDDEE